jgi:hypothetical protein
MSERATKPDRMDVLRRFQRWQEDDRGGYDQLIGLACEMAEVLQVEPSADPALPLSVDDRTRLHRLLQHAYSVIDPDAEPQLFDAIYAELKDCTDDRCVPPVDDPALPPLDEAVAEIVSTLRPLDPESWKPNEHYMRERIKRLLAQLKADPALPPELREQTDQGDGLLVNHSATSENQPPELDQPATSSAPVTKNRRMPPCAACGHSWPFHVIPGGVENIDIYPTERWCVDDDCRCRNYVGSPVCSDCPPVGYPTDATRCTECPQRSGVDGGASGDAHA